MKKAAIFLTDGFEEIETLATADILRRAGVSAELVSITGSLQVKGSHGITVTADSLINSDIDTGMTVLPGGAVVDGYMNCRVLQDILKRHCGKGGHIAAICAAPLVLGKLGLLDDKAATCYPKLSQELIAKERKDDAVVTDGNITTGRSAGVTMQFALALAAILAGEDEAQRVKDALYM